jgi:hypothetical protein
MQVVFELHQLGRNRPLGFIHASQHVGSLQSVSGNAQHGRLFRQNAVLPIKLARAPNSHAAGGFGEDAFGFS